MPRSPQRPIVVAHVLAWVGLRAFVSAGVVTALLVAALHPETPIWIAAWVVLTLLIGVFEMRQQLPGWFAWFQGRPPQSPGPN